MTGRWDSARGTKIIAFLLCLVVILGSAAAMALFKHHYDQKIDSLTRHIETLQGQINSSGSGGKTNVYSLAYTEGLSVPEIAEKAGASVVGIKITAQVKETGWFGPQIYQQVSEGSGIIYNQEG
ncbi:MAG: hypothetical protein GX044_01060, partial [Firmicutes bacterium]|nr:hypothetical protein [Bacillota bacterium]